MLTAAFVGWTAGAAAVALLGSGRRRAIFGITLPLLIGLVAAVVSGMILAALHAWLSISVRADQIISGVIINIAAIGLTGYLNTLISRSLAQRRRAASSPRRPPQRRRHPVGRLADQRDLRPGPDRHHRDHPRRHHPGSAVPNALGPAHACRWRAPASGRDSRHQRHPTALSQRDRLGRRSRPSAARTCPWSRPPRSRPR